jgi:hypothetical protein
MAAFSMGIRAIESKMASGKKKATPEMEHCPDGKLTA